MFDLHNEQLSDADLAARVENRIAFDFGTAPRLACSYPPPPKIKCHHCKQQFPVYSGEHWSEELHAWVCRGCLPKLPPATPSIPRGMLGLSTPRPSV